MKPMDRRTLRTRRMLRQALLASVLEHGWQKTSVQTICVQAGISRASFVAHFADKEELLLSGFEDLPGTLKRVDDRPFAFLRDLIAQVKEYYPLTRALRKRDALTVVPRLHKLVAQLVILDIDPRRTHAGESERDATARFIGGAIVDTIVWWLEERGDLDAASLEAMIRKMSVAALDQIGSPARDTIPQFPARRR